MPALGARGAPVGEICPAPKTVRANLPRYFARGSPETMLTTKQNLTVHHPVIGSHREHRQVACALDGSRELTLLVSGEAVDA